MKKTEENENENSHNETDKLQELAKQLSEVLLKEKDDDEAIRIHLKMKRVLSLLAKGTALALVLTLPNTAPLFRHFVKNKSDWNEWKFFNEGYLRRIIRSLEKQKLIEITKERDLNVVKITDRGRKKVLKFALEKITITKPAYWDGKWRLIFYDVLHKRDSVRKRFQKYLQSLGFYPLQKSVYLHAWPCEKEIEFLRAYLGISGEVRVVMADEIENDQLFREYFGIRQ